MKIEIEKNGVDAVAADALIVPVFKDEKIENGVLKSLDEASGGVLASIIDTGEFKGKRGETAFVHLYRHPRIARLILVGAGERGKTTPHMFAQTAGASVRLMRDKRIAHAAFLVRDAGLNIDAAKAARLIAESALLSLYEQDKYQKKEDDERFSPERLSLKFIDDETDGASIETALMKGEIVADAVNFTRDLCLEPGSTLPPRELARRAKEAAEAAGLEVQVFDESELEKMGMGALLAVSRGSEEPAQLIVIRYKASNPADPRPVALVGKGITFDSGGICIKPREGMWEMKTDMSGGAVVIGTLLAIAKLMPQVNVIGIVPTSENLPSGTAYKPGDVLKAYSGKTIEVIDTDAEGRLILADALHYATEQNPSCIIDLATLTGACVIALGSLRAAMMGSNDELLSELRTASEKAGEKLWPMPLNEDYQEMIKSDIADIKNLGGRFAGAITAGAFLREFVGDFPWAHLDIAGTAWLEENKPYMAKGPTGYGVRTLVEFITSRDKSK